MLALGLATLAGCGSAPLKKADIADLATADGRVFQGCYDCLLEARDIYARVGVGRARPLVISRLFETDLLLALREKELALDSTGSLEAARALVGELPPELAADRYVAVVADVLPDDNGTPAAERARLANAHAPRMKDVDADVAWLQTGPLRQPVSTYIAIALDCSYEIRPRRGNGTVDVPPTAPDLVQYRRAICGTPMEDVLKRILADNPRFIETSYFRARRAVAIAKEQGPRPAHELLDQAYTRFSKSPAVTYLDGNLNQLAGDCKKALTRFDETIALSPRHENGWLGRTQCMSYLGQHDDAVAAATHMIEMNAKVTDALYWRAWNWHETQQLDRARQDINAAKDRGFRTDVYRLAGMIEHDQDDLDPAERDLQSVLHSSGGANDCVAHWYLALVYLKKSRWLDSGGSFLSAHGCYQGQMAVDTNSLEKMRRRTDLDPEFQASQISGFEAALAEDKSQYYAAAFNAAAQLAHGGNIEKARSLLETASEDPALADKVKALRDIIK
jgi:tetratricopeptide (TPR) repeat protein